MEEEKQQNEEEIKKLKDQNTILNINNVTLTNENKQISLCKINSSISSFIII